MNVFVLGTGRCGTVTFIEACRFMSNYTCGHETRINKGGKQRLVYPPNHIEADNRLSWFLGRLAVEHRDAFYVHLKRDPEATARSFLNRYEHGIMRAYRRDIIWQGKGSPMDICRDYVETVTRNIELFLKYRAFMTLEIENLGHEFPRFWRAIDARGNLHLATKTASRIHNAS